MADFAYHQEALRKARIIERKNAAQSACSSRQNGNNDRQCNGDWGSASPQKMNYRDSHSSIGMSPPPIVQGTINPPQTFRSVKYNMPIPELPMTPAPDDTPITPMRTPSPTELRGTVPSPAHMKNVLPYDGNGMPTMDDMFPDDNDDSALFNLDTVY